MAEIALSRGMVAVVDDADVSLVDGIRWYATPHWHTYYALGFVTKDGKRKAVYMHRLLLGLVDPAIKCDHRDRNGLNNTRQNLRLATPTQQNYNRGKITRNGKATSKYRGVSWNVSHKKWRAFIRIDGKSKPLGSFTVEEEAARAFDAAAIRFCGEFASLNFPPGRRRADNGSHGDHVENPGRGEPDAGGPGSGAECQDAV